LWQQDAAGFLKRIDAFLAIADKHKIKPMLVLFDSCWDPSPKLEKQRAPTPGVHNSGWVQSPGAAALQDPKQYGRLEAYVRGVVGAFRNDQRILAWDIWNEPDNVNSGSYGKLEPSNKKELVAGLLAECVRMGSRGKSKTAADQRSLERRVLGAKLPLRVPLVSALCLFSPFC